MLAPRKTLWSTPPGAVDQLQKWIPLQPNDCVCDVGCGDGRILLLWAQAHSQYLWATEKENDNHLSPLSSSSLCLSSHTSSSSSSSSSSTPLSTSSPQISTTSSAMSTSLYTFLGIDIDPHRIGESQEALQEIRQQGLIHPSISIQFICANALESSPMFQPANIFFLYLIPRGLKLFYPLLQQHKQCHFRHRQLQIITYMSPLPLGDPGDVDDHFLEERDDPNDDTTTTTITHQPNTMRAHLVDRSLVRVSHQPGAAWPLYLYHM